MRRAERRRRIIAVLDRYPEYRLGGGDLLRLAHVGIGPGMVELARMEWEGVLTSDWQDPNGDYPRRRVYWRV
jgi:hypothetical protein